MAGGEEDGIKAEKKSLHARERDRKENQKRRESFLARLRALPPEKLDPVWIATESVRSRKRAIFAQPLAAETLITSVHG